MMCNLAKLSLVVAFIIGVSACGGSESADGSDGVVVMSDNGQPNWSATVDGLDQGTIDKVTETAKKLADKYSSGSEIDALKALYVTNPGRLVAAGCTKKAASVEQATSIAVLRDGDAIDAAGIDAEQAMKDWYGRDVNIAETVGCEPKRWTATDASANDVDQGKIANRLSADQKTQLSEKYREFVSTYQATATRALQIGVDGSIGGVAGDTDSPEIEFMVKRGCSDSFDPVTAVESLKLALEEQLAADGVEVEKYAEAFEQLETDAAEILGDSCD